MELKDLLIEWAGLEGDRCLHRQEEAWESFSVRRGLALHIIWTADADINPICLDLLQGAIQEAIVAAGWLFHLGNARGESNCYATVQVGDRTWKGKAEEGAIALLMAYVGCLKSAKGLEVKA